jgi:predicted nucleotidyltransferase
MVNPVELLRAHEEHLRSRYAVARIGVFGSHARGENNGDSDVDVLVEFTEPTFDNLMDLSFYLEELLGVEVDIVTTGGLSPHISESILEEVVWCE